MNRARIGNPQQSSQDLHSPVASSLDDSCHPPDDPCRRESIVQEGGSEIQSRLGQVSQLIQVQAVIILAPHKQLAVRVAGRQPGFHLRGGNLEGVDAEDEDAARGSTGVLRSPPKQQAPG